MSFYEKVLKGLEAHKSVGGCSTESGEKCPYYMPDVLGTTCLNKLHEDAINLIKEQNAEIDRLHIAAKKTENIYELIEKSIKFYLEHKQRPAECVILNRPAWEQAKREMSIAAIPLKVENPNAPDGYISFHGVRLRVIDDNQKTPRVYVSDEWQRFTFGATYAENND